jgi:uncharacterized membrane protein (UPF0127 family)
MTISKTFITNSLIMLLILAFFVFITRQESKPKFEELSIEKSDGSIVKFTVEIAQTQEEQEKGLMFRKDMPKNEGMLFMFEDEKVIEMWMKNTDIPLDMLFISKYGIIKKIVKNTTPNSAKTISSETSVIAVLEINAMLSDELYINENDIVLHRLFAVTE